MKHTDRVSRRHFAATAGLMSVALWLNPRLLVAEKSNLVVTTRASAANSKITIQKLRGSVSMLEGSGGNIAVLTGRDGKLLIDAGMTASRPRITEALASLSHEPVKHVINSHWHFDHTDGNEWLHSVGAEIIAHENTRKRLSETTRVEDWNFTFPPSPKGALPTQTFAEETTMQVNGTTIALKYYGPCHTDTDISVHLTDADVLCSGDTWWNGHYPFIDYSTGGSIDGHIRAAAANIAKVSSKTLVIPGPGPVGGKAELTEYHDMLVAVRESVGKLKKAGLSRQEIVSAKPTAAFDKKWGGFFINGAAFTDLVYAGV